MTSLSGALAFDGPTQSIDQELREIGLRQSVNGEVGKQIDSQWASFCASATPGDRLSGASAHRTARYLLLLQARAHDLARWDFAGFIRRWETDRIGALAGLRHDFAIALWDDEARALFLARAPLSAFGLAFRRDARGAAFATMAQALRTDRNINVARLVLPFGRKPLFGSAMTAFEDVAVVACGTVVRIDAQTATATRFWHAGKIAPVERSDADAAAYLREQTERAVADAIEGGDDPIASFLSAGRDSGIVTAIAARQLGHRQRPLAAFTAVPPAGYATLHGRYLYDEGPGAARVAGQFTNVDHHLFRASRFALSAALDRANRNLAAPYGTPVNLAWYYGIQRAASQLGARLVLSGDTGNLTVSNGGPWAIPDLLDDNILAWGRTVRAARRAPGASTLSLLATSLGGAGAGFSLSCRRICYGATPPARCNAVHERTLAGRL